jgi:hypothetical protein
MPVRWAVHEGLVRGAGAVLVTSAAVLCSAQGVAAQLLNLESAAAPAPGEGRAVSAAVKALQGQINAEKKRIEAGGAGAEGAGLRLNARQIAKRLLESGEAAGPAGSGAIVQAYTLLRAMPEVDAVAGLIDGGNRPDVAQAAGVLEEEAVGAGEGLDAPALRDGLALLLRLGVMGTQGDDAARATGWLSTPAKAGGAAGAAGSLDAAVGEWEKGGLDAETVAALRDLAAALDAGGAWQAYRRNAQHLARIVVQAGAVLQPAGTAVSRWAPGEARTDLVARFCASAKGLGENGDAGQAAFAEMHRVAVAAGIAARLNALNPGALVERPLRASFEKVIRAVGPGGDEALSAFASAVALATEHRETDENGVAREVRPAWRVLDARAKRTQADIVEALSRLGSAPAGPGADPMADPALVGAVAAHRQALADLRALDILSGAIGGKPADGAAEQVAKVKARVLRLGQELSKAGQAPDALGPLRGLAAALEDSAYLAGDAVVRGFASEDWARATRGRGAELGAAAPRAIEDYLALWSVDPPGAGGRSKEGRPVAEAQRELDRAAERLRLLRRLAERLDEWAALSRMTASGELGPGYVLQSWPGWEMPAPVLATLDAGLNERLASCAGLAIAGKNDELRKSLAEIDKTYSAARLAAALERRFESAGLASCPAMAELAESPIPSGGAIEAAEVLGIAEGTWMGAARGEIAEVCRYAPEYAEAINADAKRAGRIRAYIEGRAADALRKISER